jgi:hypothetical protein
MAHYAFLDENNIVTEVIVGRDEDEVVDGISDWEQYYGNERNQTCKRTSYNSNIRKHFAGIGYSYNQELDAFIPPKPFDSWILDEESCSWVAPKEKPDNETLYYWDEESLDWVVLEIIEPDFSELEMLTDEEYSTI